MKQRAHKVNGDKHLGQQGIQTSALVNPLLRSFGRKIRSDILL